MGFIVKLLLAVGLTIGSIAAFAWEASAGSLRIVEPWARAAPAGAKTAAGYLEIVNDGSAPDRLVSAESPAARSVELHEMTMEGDVMKMRRLSEGIEIPAGGSLALAPGGYHLMFTGLAASFAADTEVEVTLSFETAGEMKVILPVRTAAPRSPEGHDGQTH